LLVLVAALFGGVSAGYAAAGGAERHCTTAPDSTLPSGHDGTACCPGMIGGTPVVPPPSLTLPDFQPTQTEASFAPRIDVWVPPLHLTRSDQPRGPPAQV
jgi:hypothetical protein